MAMNESMSQRGKRFLISTVAFVVFVCGLILVYAHLPNLGIEPFYGVVTIFLVSIAAYGFYGYASDTPFSVFVLFIPLLFSFVPDTAFVSGNYLDGEMTWGSLDSIWPTMSLFVFLPAWAVGCYIGYLKDRTYDANPIL